MKVIHKLSTEKDFKDDERVLCMECGKAEFVGQRLSMPTDAFEKLRKINAKPMQWMWPIAKIKNGWASAQWDELHCKVTGLPALPKDVRHHCQLYSSAKTETVSVESDWWVT